MQLQQQLAEQLSALQSKAASLSSEERERLQTLLQSSSDSRQLEANQPTASSDDSKKYRRFPDKGPPEKPAEIPPLVRKLFAEAGVEDAVPWDGRPAEPPKTEYAEEPKWKALQVPDWFHPSGCVDIPLATLFIYPGIGENVAA